MSAHPLLSPPGQARRVAVIGAGAAGLCAAKHLLNSGLEVTVYEMGSQVGGLWVYENDNGISAAYASLHLNSENRVTAYADFPFPPDAPLYPDHKQVCSYLRSYAHFFGVMPHIRFGVTVKQVQVQGAQWRITLADGSDKVFDAVVVGSGHQNRPAHPEWRSQFSGEYLHSHSYRVPEPFRGKRVLVVGMGNSAVDIAADICTLTCSTVLSARSPVLVMPRMLFGVPTSRVLGRLEKPWMPWPVRRFMRQTLTRVVHGRMEQWGFVTPQTRTHPTSHLSLMAHFAWDRIRARPGIRSVQGQAVEFSDGHVEVFDTIIAGTGYHVDLPFLAPELMPMNGHQLDLFLRVVHPRHQGLYFIGMFNVTGGGNIRMMDDQAQWITELIAGTQVLPPEPQMRQVMVQEQNYLRKNFPQNARYALELDPAFYRQQLQRQRRAGQHKQQVAQS